MVTDLMVFRRRNVFERKALQLVRGETANAGEPDEAAGFGASIKPGFGKYKQAQFECLRESSRRNGLTIRSVGCQYVSADELAILRWLAEAQRQTGLRTCYFHDARLKASLRYCANILKELGVLLPPQTLNIYSNPGDGFRSSSRISG